MKQKTLRVYHFLIKRKKLFGQPNKTTAQRIKSYLEHIN